MGSYVVYEHYYKTVLKKITEKNNYTHTQAHIHTSTQEHTHVRVHTHTHTHTDVSSRLINSNIWKDSAVSKFCKYISLLSVLWVTVCFGLKKKKVLPHQTTMMNIDTIQSCKQCAKATH